MYVKLLRNSWDDFAVCAGVLAGFFLGAHIITAVVLAFFSDGTSLMLSGMILPIISGFLVVIYSMGYSGFQFSHLVRFGCTRRRALALTLCLEAATALFCMVLSALLTGLERLAAPALWQAITGSDGVYYGIMFILYLTDVFVPNLPGICLMFGCGMALDFIPSIILYIRMLKRENLKIDFRLESSAQS